MKKGKTLRTCKARQPGRGVLLCCQHPAGAAKESGRDLGVLGFRFRVLGFLFRVLGFGLWVRVLGFRFRAVSLVLGWGFPACPALPCPALPCAAQVWVELLREMNISTTSVHDPRKDAE